MKVVSRVTSLFFLLACFHANGQEVRTKTIGEIADYPLRNAPATVLSLNESTISAEIASSIVDIPVLVGDVVERGTSLIILDCQDYELIKDRSISSLQALEAKKQWAEKRLQRTQRLNNEASASEEELDSRQLEVTVLDSDIESARAVVSQAMKDVSRCIIKSPMNAVVTSRYASLGEYAVPGVELIQLVDIENIEVSAQVSSSEIEFIKSAKKLQFSFADNYYPLIFRTILPVVNTDTRNYEIRFTFPQKKGPVGAAGKLIWEDSRPHISGDYIVERNGELGVFTVFNGKAKFYSVADARPGRIIAIDLPMEAEIITEGHYALENDSDINIID